MKTTKHPRPSVAVVSAHDRSTTLQTVLERAGYDVTIGYAHDFRASTTAFSTFVETYKPDAIVLDLHPPVAEAVKDLLSFRSLPAAEGRAFIVACSDADLRARLPEAVKANAVPLVIEDLAPLVNAIRDALSAREAA